MYVMCLSYGYLPCSLSTTPASGCPPRPRTLHKPWLPFMVFRRRARRCTSRHIHQGPHVDNNHDESNNVEKLKSGSVEKEAEIRIEPADDHPDGGFRAWLVVTGAAFICFSSFGYVTSWGVFQAYYEQTFLKDKTPSVIAWIGSVQYSLLFLPGSVMGRLFDLGYLRLPIFVASILLVVATFLVAECTQYWHFILCQGIVVGLACGSLFPPALNVTSHWFKAKRGLALGIMTTGSGVGGAVLPIALRNLIETVGFKWALRILGFILIFTLGIANLTVRTRLEPTHAVGKLIDLRAFRLPQYTTYSIALFFLFLGLYTTLTYITASALAAGLSADFSFYLVAIANAASGLGRLSSGLISDKIGPINIMAPYSLGAAVLTFAWPFATTKGSLGAVAVLYGFATGACAALLPYPAMNMGDRSGIGSRVGMGMTFIAMGAISGPPISGAIETKTGGFEAVGYYAGSAILIGVFFLCITRWLALRRLWGKF